MKLSPSTTKPLALAVALALAAVLVVNALANILPLNGVNTGVLSDEIPNLFVPAGLTFSIWGLIYLLLAGYAGAVLVEAFGKKPSGVWSATDGLVFLANAALNVVWIFSWHWRLIPLSFAIMLGILGTLIHLTERIHARSKELAVAHPVRAFLLRTPLRVYLGWICVATIANATAVLVKAGWDGFGLSQEVWTVAMIVAGLAIGLALLYLRGATASALVVVWAYAGIAIKRSVDGGVVFYAAIVAAAVLALAVCLRELPKLAKRPLK